MDFIDRLREISAKIPKLKEQGVIKTEEGTKNALIMPFINALGYNVFDPTEVTPELVADVGTKKGEKVDYAILSDGKPIMLFECKTFGTNLSLVHASQLYRYFSVTKARFGILTDGVQYRFYSDLDQTNTMDSKPFFIFDMSEIREDAVEELKRFTRGAFNFEAIMINANELKYKGLMREYLELQVQQPSDDLVKLFASASGAYTGRFTQNVIDDFRNVVREAIRMFINEQIDNRLKSALAVDQSAAAPAPVVAPVVESAEKVITTQEETDAFLIVKALLRDLVDVKRITMRDAQSYCAILLDDNNRRPLVRLYFSVTKKQVGIFDDQRHEQKYPLTTVDDLYPLAAHIRAAMNRYEQQPTATLA